MDERAATLTRTAAICSHTLRLLREAREAELPGEAAFLAAVRRFVSAWERNWSEKWRPPAASLLSGLVEDAYADDLALERERQRWRRDVGWTAPVRGVREEWRKRVLALRSLDDHEKQALGARLRGRGMLEATETFSLSVVVRSLEVPEAAQEEFRQAFREAFEAGMRRGAQEAALNLGQGADWLLKDPKAVQTMREYAGFYGDRISALIPASQQVELKKALVAALDEGKGVPEVTAAIRQQYADLRGWEAHRIARTEANRARGVGSVQAFEAASVQWVDWVVADSPCEMCDPLAGWRMTLAEFLALHPRHPNCLCSCVPAEDEVERIRREALLSVGVEPGEIVPWEAGPEPRYQQTPRT